jgi:PAS domain S-box-containing protein
LAVLLLGSATLFQHFSGIDLGIDTMLVEPAWGVKAAMSPGRMGPPASTSYTLLGLALVLIATGRERARRIVPALGIVVSAIAVLALMGYASGADPLFAVAKYTGIAMQTATVLLALALGVLASVPEYEPVRTLQAHNAAGLLARRSLPFIIGLPFVLGWLRIRGQEAGWFDTAMGTSLLALLLVVIFCALLRWWVGAVATNENELAGARDMLATTVASIGDAVIATDEDGDVLFLNAEAERLTGWHSSEAKGQPLPKIFHIINEQTRQPADNPVEKVFRTGMVVGLGNHTLLISRDGRETPIDDSAAPIREPDGPLFGVVLVFRDVAERRQRERQLTVQAGLLDLSTDAIFARDMQNRITYWSKGAEESYGYSREEAMGETTHGLLQTIFPESLERIDETLRRDGRWAGELIHTCKDGSKKVEQSRWALERDAEGNPVSVLETNNDITERNRAERRLSVNHAVTRILAESPAVSDAIPRILQVVGEGLDWTVGDMWILDSESNVLRCLNVWHAPTAAIDAFKTVTSETTFSSGFSLPGRVWASLQPVCVSDVGQDANFARAPQAVSVGLRAAFAFPVLAGEEFLGVMEFFSPEVREPDDALLQMLTGIGSQIGQFIQRKRAQDKIAEQTKAVESANARLQGIIFSAMDAVITINSQQRIVLFNPAAEAMFGRKAGHTEGKHIECLIPERFRSSHGKFVDAFGDTGVSSRRMGALGAISGQRANGEEFPIEASISQIEISGEKLFTVILRDITERKKTEERVGRLAAIVDNTEDAIVGKTLDGIVTSWNRGAEELFRYSEEEMIGRSIRQIIPPESAAEEDVILTSVRAGRAVHRETVRLKKSGERVAVSITCSPVKNSAGEIIGGAKIARDITEQKETEEKLRDAQRKLLLHAADLEATVAERTAKLRETVNDLQGFSYSIAHDMRAPLRAMGTFAQLLMSEMPAASASPDAKNYCERIMLGAARLDNLINDALNYTKTALQEFQLQPVDISKLVRGLLDTYPNLHPEHADVQLEGTLPIVLGNEALLTQCFSNLLGNAVKFIAPGQRPKVRVYSEANDSVARISVEDNGIGIPKHAQPRLFAMFQKLDNQYEGTGIGLAIVRKVVERMGGKVGVESEPGRGSRFWVELRVAPKKEDV